MSVSVVGSCQWVRPEEPPGFVLVEGRDSLFVLPGANFTIYDPPLATPDLARRFSALDGSPEGFLEFANEFGLLATGWEWASDDGGRPVPLRSQEPLRVWREAHARLAELVRLQDEMEQAGRVDPMDLLHRTIRLELEQPERRSPWGAVSSVQAIRATNGGGHETPALALRVSTLERAILLQFALDVLAGKRWLQCEGCLKWMNLSDPNQGRPDRRSCSPACRVRASRRRKAGQASTQEDDTAFPDTGATLRAAVSLLLAGLVWLY